MDDVTVEVTRVDDDHQAPACAKERADAVFVRQTAQNLLLTIGQRTSARVVVVGRRVLAVHPVQVEGDTLVGRAVVHAPLPYLSNCGVHRGPNCSALWPRGYLLIIA